MAHDGQVNVRIDEAPQRGDDGVDNGVHEFQNMRLSIGTSMAPQDGDGANDVHEVNAREFQNMRLSIGTVGRDMLDISLSENLHDTRRIDVRLRQDKNSSDAAPEPGDDDDSSDNALPAAANDQQTPDRHLQSGGVGARRGRLKITVAAEHDVDGDKEYLDKMRGWLMMVATLFVNMAFQAVAHPPDWMLPSSPPGSAEDTTAKTEPFLFFDMSARLPFYRDRRLFTYMIVNMLTFGTSLALVVILLQQTASARRTLTTVTAMVCVVSGSLAASFALATSESWKVVHTVYFFVVVYESYIAGRVYLGRGPIGYLVARLVGRRVPPNSRMVSY